jgi:PBSX family phage terminase large subunit
MAVHLEEFTAEDNPSQDRFLDTMINEVVPKAETEGVQYVILSGARGSGKSLAVEYFINWMCMEYPGIEINLSRISIKEIKDTLFKELKVMTPSKVLAKDNAESITFVNKSHVKCVGYGDGNVRKIRGNNCHVWVMEEVTEDALKSGLHELNLRALEEITMVTRNPGAPKIIIILTNPEDPEHWLYRKYIDLAGYVDGDKTNTKKRKENVHVYYSLTSDNPHLGEAFLNNLQETLSPKQAERYIYGKWVSLATGGVYNEYLDELHWHPDIEYKINKQKPIILSWDFNTAKDKPMSTCISQYINDTFHVFDECVLENSNTRGVLEELEERGFFKQFIGTQQLQIMGDAAGWAKQSAGTMSDYGLIKQFIDHLPYKINYKIMVPKSNPAVKGRHNLVNAYLKNLKGDIRVAIYSGAETLRRGMKSTQLKKGATYKEDDSNPNQHITTAFGYMVWRCTRKSGGVEKLDR